SCGCRLETILVVQAAEHRCGNDSVAFAYPMAIGTRCEAVIRRIRYPWPETGLRAAPIVVGHPLGQHMAYMALVRSKQKLETLTADRADQPFTEGIGLRRTHRRLEHRKAHRRNGVVNSLSENAVVIVQHKTMGRLA